jgi:hypothetical protein
VIEDPIKVKRVLDGLRLLSQQVSPQKSSSMNYAAMVQGGSDNIFADAIAVIQNLCSEVAANEFVYAEKDAAMDAVNEGNGIADDDCWARLKGQRDQLLAACEAFIGSSIAGANERRNNALELAEKAVRNVKVGR